MSLADLDPLFLSRVQFAFVMSFHILFPAFTIGLASFLAMLEALHLWTGREVYWRLYRFWIQLFAVSFGLGVVSGIVMSYQFGTNWSRFSASTGNILGPLMSYEVITAFFLEAAFLGIMLFGRDRVGPRLHFASTVIVAVGTLLSTFWIISANSWMHTPAGFALREGVFYPVDWWAIVFNPSFPNRLLHMVLAAYLTTCFVVAGVSAWHLWRGTAPDTARAALKMAMIFAAIVAPAQIVAGDLQGLSVLEHQPAKLAAIEGHWETRRGAPLILFAVPDAETQSNRYELAIPKLGSIILKHDPDGEIRGLKTFAPQDRPPVLIPFFGFRIMVAIGFAMLAVGLSGAFLLWRGRLYETRWFHVVLMAMTPSGFLAVLTGWFVAEVGRQPWVVYGQMRTAQAVAPVSGTDVAISLAAFALAYTAIFGFGTYYLLRLIWLGPGAAQTPVDPGRPDRQPKRPLSVPDASPEPAE